LTSPSTYVRRTRTTPACRSTSRRSSAIHSHGRSPVSAANVGIARNAGRNSAPIASSSSSVNVGTSDRFGSGFGTATAGFSSSSFARTA